jgi:mannosyltransferase OCH1-like enzyme
MLPKNIVLFFYDKNRLSKSMIGNYDNIKAKHPDFNIELYDTDSALEFIKKNYDNRIVVAYKKIRPYGYKSHLFRYCYLYKRGGIFIDIRYDLILDFNFRELLNNEYMSMDSNKTVKTPLIALKPFNELMRQMIYEIAYHTETNYYGTCHTDVTGSSLLTKLYNKIYEDGSPILMMTWIISGLRPTLFFNGALVLKEYATYMGDLINISDQQSTAHMYFEEDIYNWV